MLHENNVTGVQQYIDRQEQLNYMTT